MNEITQTLEATDEDQNDIQELMMINTILQKNNISNGKFRNLTVINLQNNNLNSFSGLVCKTFLNLKEIDLSYNLISTISPEI